jgi:(p)ppGpp synthase/HD superfamily hydrolase
MNAVRAAGFKKLYQACAVLHDTLEDTKMTIEELPEFQGYVGDRERLIAALQAITRQKDEIYRDYFLRCMDNPIARVVKYYDLMDNCDPKRFHPKAPLDRYFKSLAWFHERSEFWPLPISLEELEISRDPIPF